MTKYCTVAHKVLSVEEDIGATVDEYKTLDNLVDAAISKVAVNKNETDVVEIEFGFFLPVSKVIRDEGFSYYDEPIFHKALRAQKLNCFGYSLVYLAVAQKLNLPVFGVMTPNHMLLRWQDDSVYLNFDPTYRDITADNELIQKFKIPQEGIRVGAYLKSLTESEVLSVAHNHKAGLFQNSDVLRAEKYVSAALSLHPNLLEARILASYVFLRSKNYAKSIENADFVLRLMPSNYSAYCYKGFSLYYLNDSAGAFENFNASIKENPNFAIAKKGKGIVYLKRDEFSEAIKSFSEAICCCSADPEVYLLRAFAYAYQGDLVNSNSDMDEAVRIDEAGTITFVRNNPHMFHLK